MHKKGNSPIKIEDIKIFEFSLKMKEQLLNVSKCMIDFCTEMKKELKPHIKELKTRSKRLEQKYQNSSESDDHEIERRKLSRKDKHKKVKHSFDSDDELNDSSSDNMRKKKVKKNKKKSID